MHTDAGSVAERPRATDERGYELEITRVFDAPRELVWRAWTDPEMTKQWMGPRGFEATEFVASTEVGSRWSLAMEGHQPGTERMVRLQQSGVTRRFHPPELLEYTFAWEDRAAVGLSESPYRESLVTVRFEAHGSKTVMHFRQAPFATESERNGHKGGWNSSFDRLAEYVFSEQPWQSLSAEEAPSEVHLRRRFKAPRELVFAAWTTPEIVAQWWGPRCFTNPLCELDARGGGAIRIHMEAPDGTVHPMTGQFVEFYPPYRFHFTSWPLDGEGEVLFEQWTSVYFADVDGATEVLLDVHVTDAQPEATQHLRGMREGWGQSLERLGEMLGCVSGLVTGGTPRDGGLARG